MSTIIWKYSKSLKPVNLATNKSRSYGLKKLNWGTKKISERATKEVLINPPRSFDLFEKSGWMRRDLKHLCRFPSYGLRTSRPEPP